ncbi:molydopterin dinucleotide-binding region protein [Haloferula helveola]|uniref:Molydopterin dinucleotide-binding region protein n=1 Tax=Haloferula helveola TaxID=490095 RepID=A0ABM7REL9_9BACT|nr:molydopterin dinucleotide-binding region protein [Haloferula helveola]
MNTVGLLTGYQRESQVESVLQQLCGALDFKLETLSNFQQLDSFAHAVWGLINISDVLIADLTNLTNNLCYEIGLAHGAGKPVVLVADNYSDVPADLAGQHIIALHSNKYPDDNTLFRLETALRRALAGRDSAGFSGPRDRPEGVYRPPANDSLSHDFRSLFAYEGFARSRRFEEWIHEAFSGIPGWEVIDSAKGMHGDRQFDFMLWNSLDDPELVALGNPIGVEVKSIRAFNRSRLSWLLHSARQSGLKSVILMTTGSNPPSAKRRLAQLRHEEGINAIALDRDDLLEVHSSTDLLRALKSRVRQALYHDEF